MEINTEPKEAVSTDTFEKAYSEVTSGQEQPQETAQPEIEQTKPVEEGLTDNHKTDSTQPEVSNASDKGFASHPAWIEREAKLKEAREELIRLKEEQQKIQSLLADPNQLASLLQNNGYQINKKAEETLFDKIAAKKGWDVKSLSPEQASYIRDLIDLSADVSDARIEQALAKKLGPLENQYRESQTQQKTKQDFESAQELVGKYGIDFEKEVAPALSKYLDELDRTDPQKKVKVDLLAWTKDHVLSIMQEKMKLQGRQDERDQKKSVLKTLTPSASSPQITNKGAIPSYRKDPKGFDKVVDNLIDEMGYKE
jgi:hypothetical protein